MNERHETVRRLLRAEDGHYRAIREMRATPAYFDDAVFGSFVQQQAELLLRAWLALLGEESPPADSSLEEMLETLRARGARVGEWDGLAEYEPYAFRFRREPKPARKLDRDAAVGRGEGLRHQVCLLLEREGGAPAGEHLYDGQGLPR